MILYKYCNQNGLNILRDLKIKITPPSEFNDPFEFLPTAQEKFSKKWAQEQIKIKTIQNELRIRFKKDGYYSGNKHQFKKYLEQRQDFALEYITQIYPQMQVFICRGMVDFCSERFGVFCLSRNPTNILMWSHYAQNHKGIVIEFDFTNDPEKNKLYKVKYSQNRIHIPPSINQKNIFAQK